MQVPNSAQFEITTHPGTQNNALTMLPQKMNSFKMLPLQMLLLKCFPTFYLVWISNKRATVQTHNGNF